MKFKVLATFTLIFQAFCGSPLIGSMVSSIGLSSSSSSSSITTTMPLTSTELTTTISSVSTSSSSSSTSSSIMPTTSSSSVSSTTIPAIAGTESTSVTSTSTSTSSATKTGATSDQSIVIVLNGPSGSGKTRLSLALKAEIEKLGQSVLNLKSWQVIALDQIPDKEIRKYKETKNITSDNLAVIARIQKAAQIGNVICDTVLSDAKEACAFMQALAKIKKLYHVLVYCNLKELAQRSINRKTETRASSASPTKQQEADRYSVDLLIQYRTLFSPSPSPSPTQRSQSSTTDVCYDTSSSSSSSTSIFRQSPQLKQSPMYSPDPLDIISEDDIKTACMMAIPTERITTVKPLADKAISKPKKATVQIVPKKAIDSRARDYMIGNLLNGFSAFTLNKTTGVIPNPDLHVDLVVKSTTDAEGKQAVIDIIKLISTIETDKKE